MTRQQFEWAKTHDWYRSFANVGTYQAPEFHVFVAGAEVHVDKSVTWDRQDFTDYQALRAWAGY